MAPAPLPARLRWLILGATAESVGDAVSRALLPIVAVSVLGAGPATVGVVNSLGLLAFLVLALPLGSLADRWGRPTAVMTTSTLVRAAAVAAGVGAWALGLLEGATGLAVAVLMALVLGVADVGYTTGQGLLVPRLVGPGQVRAVYGRVQAASQTGGALGPILLAGMLTLVAAPVAWFGATGSYLLSVLSQRGVQPVPTVATTPVRRSVRADARGGLRRLVRNPALRRITLANTLNNSAVMAANTLLPVVALTALGIPPATYAVLGVVGAGATSPGRPRHRPSRCGSVCGPPALPPRPAWASASSPSCSPEP